MAKKGDFGGFLDLNPLLGLGMRSNLVQIARDTSADVVKGLKRPPGPYFTLKSLLGCPENQDLGPKWPFLAF